MCWSQDDNMSVMMMVMIIIITIERYASFDHSCLRSCSQTHELYLSSFEERYDFLKTGVLWEGRSMGVSKIKF